MSGAFDVGMVGLGTMGRSLALNMVDRGLRVAGLDLDVSKREALSGAGGENATALGEAEGLCAVLRRPRRVMLMVPAGAPVDAVIETLVPHLQPGDVIIDGGNSHFADTERRLAGLAPRGVLFVGAGVSGGEEGARHGPSIMPGGSGEAWSVVEPVLRPIAAVAHDGEPCCEWLGSGGVGHAVKTVHNGIEYALMQLIAEAYDLLRAAGLGAPETAAVFQSYNDGPLRSYLIELTAGLLLVRDGDSDVPLVDLVLDEAQQKGTGRWTTELSLAEAVPCPTLAEAVYARGLSARRGLRERLSSAGGAGGVRGGPDAEALEASLHDALLAGFIASYAQGLDLIGVASESHGWGVRLPEVARLWRAGCIIRADMLDGIASALSGEGREHLLLDARFRSVVRDALPGLRAAVVAGAGAAVPTPCLSSGLAYLDAMQRGRLPANLIMAQRDAFGAHTFRRVDRAGVFHADWTPAVRATTESGG